MQINKLGEFGLIERFKRRLKFDSSVIKGPGDDCAVIKFNKEEFLLLTCDMIVEGVDFTKKDNPKIVGRKALAVSISDIAACGGIPRYCLVSMGLPLGSKVESVDSILSGMLKLAKEYKINIVGGDLSRADKLTIDVSMIGIVEKNNLVLRSGAKNRDIIFVTGALGGSIKGKHLRFQPRVKEARNLVSNYKVNSMIDISDGLAQDLGHILKGSNKGAVIYEVLIPLTKEARGLKDALYMGEDFELIFTTNQEEAKRIMARHDLNVFPIGEITDKKFGVKLVDKENRESILPLEGFRHF